ncbi:hypothetical protein FHT80_002165 [Rhizobium sp. BK226]|uniref:Trifolitoxin-processing protein TfxD n=1 Tax=Rhizobium leguminosarum bv. trifolii TaxID=386 RepID=TFXD_RHILT|nr:MULTISPECIES: hypothetical protein [Rhizobium]P42726.1 RecName: Full=Trifolitoxin-processing protein TfxD [Rhizobium leguminosarum bv. trifolii]AAA26366.1 precursor; putative [Rhizobium leguminosarum]MBB3300935.1 hypothetical protein [Rhizobium sp. BK112]MBB3368558.1 hypothetical protein [Rhizobium sp. BK077]MBB4112843.1 hypothetical protein [Rhizobium sp. BK226]MBB4180825.1 hypothetical protein [Rhizobium sp. BK109]
MSDENQHGFYRTSFEYASISWRRMIPNVADTIVVTLIGATALQVASNVLITILTLNIAFLNFCSLICMHNLKRGAKADVFAAIVRAACMMIGVYLALIAVSVATLEGAPRTQTIAFIALSALRPFVAGWNAYCAEVFFAQGKRQIVRSVITRSSLIYAGVNLLFVGLSHFAGTQNSIISLLIGVYLALFHNALAYARILPTEWRFSRQDLKDVFSLRKLDLVGIGAGLSASFINMLEMGFLALVGWVVAAKFPQIAVFYFPFFTLVELTSGLAIGLGRSVTERLITPRPFPRLHVLIAVYSTYSLLCFLIYVGLIGVSNRDIFALPLSLAGLALLFLICDGLQLVVRGYTLAKADGGKLTHLSAIAYLASGVILALAAVLGSVQALAIALVLGPLFLAISIPAVQSRTALNALPNR